MTQNENFYIKYKQAALNAAAGTKVFPETILAAAALESGNGLSSLAAKYNNFFGIKAGGAWKGRTITLNTKEQTSKGAVYTVAAAFRVYDHPADSFKNYVQFISGPRYVAAGVLKAATPTEQFIALKKAGYATDAKYVDKLVAQLKSFGKFIADSPASSGLAAAALFFCSIN